MDEHEMPRPWQMQLLDVLTRYLLEPEQQRAAWVMMNTVDDMFDGSKAVCEMCAQSHDWLHGSREAADVEADVKAMMARILRGNA